MFITETIKILMDCCGEQVFHLNLMGSWAAATLSPCQSSCSCWLNTPYGEMVLYDLSPCQSSCSCWLNTPIWRVRHPCSLQDLPSCHLLEQDKQQHHRPGFFNAYNLLGFFRLKRVKDGFAKLHLSIHTCLNTEWHPGLFNMYCT